MKKLLAIVAIVAFIASISSCKVHERCPAYGKWGKAPVKKVEKV